MQRFTLDKDDPIKVIIIGGAKGLDTTCQVKPTSRPFRSLNVAGSLLPPATPNPEHLLDNTDGIYTLMNMSYGAYIARRLRYSGFTRLGLEVLAKLGFNLRPFILFREGLFDSAPEELTTGLEGYETKYLGAEDMRTIAALAELPGRNISEDELQQRLVAGNKCLAVLKDEKMAAFIWCDLNNCTFAGYPFAVRANEAYLFDTYTFLPFRGKSLAPRVRYRLYQDLARAGRDTCYSMSDRLNRPSIKFKQKLKAQMVVSGVYIVLFSRWQFTLFLKKYTDHVPPSSVQPRRN